MGHDLRHAALAVLSAFAVLLAASLFPATGFGTYPSSLGDGDARTGDSGAGLPSQPEPVESSTPRQTTDRTDTETTTATETETTADAAETTTAAASGSDSTDDGSGGGLTGGWALLGILLLPFVVFFVLLSFWKDSTSDSDGAQSWGNVWGLGWLFGSDSEVPSDTLFGELLGSSPIEVPGVLARGVPEQTMTLIVGFSSSGVKLMDDTGTLLREGGNAFALVTARSKAGLFSAGSALSETSTGVASSAGRLLPRLPGLSGAMSGLASDVPKSSFFGLLRSDSDADAATGADADGGDDADADEDTGPPSVEEAWHAMARTVRSRRTATPGEVARAAVRLGYPDEAVRRLTEVFREVRYGDFPADDERTSAARAALDRIERYRDGGDDS